MQKQYVTGKMFFKASPGLWVTAVCVASSGSGVTLGEAEGPCHAIMKLDATEPGSEQELIKGQS